MCRLREVRVAGEGDVLLAQADEEVQRRRGGFPECLWVEVDEVED